MEEGEDRGGRPIFLSPYYVVGVRLSISSYGSLCKWRARSFPRRAASPSRHPHDPHTQQGELLLLPRTYLVARKQDLRKSGGFRTLVSECQTGRPRHCGNA